MWCIQSTIWIVPILETKLTNNKKQWKYNPIAKDLATTKYRQRIKRPKSPYDDDQFDIQDELDEYYKDKDKEGDE